MSLQGPIIVVANEPATDVVEEPDAVGGFPVVKAKCADGPIAFVAVKPVGVAIAEAGALPNESAIPIALPVHAAPAGNHLIARLCVTPRVGTLHATVVRRIERFAAQDGRLPAQPVGDALKEANVLIAGRDPPYPAFSVIIGERVTMPGALSVENAARHLETRYRRYHGRRRPFVTHGRSLPHRAPARTALPRRSSHDDRRHAGRFHRQPTQL